MEITDVISGKVDEELDDARKYMSLAMEFKDDAPEAAELFGKLADEEMEHVKMLHHAVAHMAEAHEEEHDDEAAKGKVTR